MQVQSGTARRALLIAIPAALLTFAGALAWGTSGAVSAVTTPGPAAFDDLLALVAAGVGWAVLSWLAVALLVSLAAAAWRRAGRLDQVARAITPLALRRLAALLLGVGLVGAPVVLALPAQADRTVATATQIAQTAEPHADPPALERWTPDRPAPAVVSLGHPAEPLALLVSRPHRGRAVSDHVVVRRGDTLWDIAARALGPDATAAEIAASWPRWHATNRSTIGPDPDLILPGQLLRPPGT
ncbi:MAG: LysM domain-containing protein [Sporichthyaceae bacterium]